MVARPCRRLGHGMNDSRPTYIRRDVFTGPAALVGTALPFWISFAKRRLRRWNQHVSKLFVLAPGTRENYFHFLIGYLLPLVHAQGQRRCDGFQALDCGPLMTPILEESLTRLGYEFRIVKPEAIVRPVCVEAWDRPDSPWRSPDAVWSAVDIVRNAWRGYTCRSRNCPRSENLLIQRSDPHEHHLRGAPEFRGYGTSRRGIANVQEVSDALSARGVDHAVYEPGAHCLGCQIETFARARRLLGFRGAEWANLIWSASGTRIRVLDHDPPAKTLDRFAKRLGIRHEFVIVDGPHAPENPQDALRFFTAPHDTTLSPGHRPASSREMGQ